MLFLPKPGPETTESQKLAKYIWKLGKLFPCDLYQSEMLWYWSDGQFPL